MNEAEIPPLAADGNGKADEWNWHRRLVFRFLFCFLVSVFLPLPFGPIPGTQPVEDAYRAAWNQVTPWVGKHVLGLTEPVPVGLTGSSDMTHNWILLLCLLALSAGAAVLWSAFDRRRQIHPWWVDGLNVYLRYGLGYIMLFYGFGKVFPSQFPPITYDQLISPLGRFSPMGLLWAFMGASKGYTMFAGAAEILAGVLLFFRRTALLGALICGAVMTNVLALNLFYDVPVKLYSALLLATATFLILPDAQRLASLLLLNRAAPARDLSMPSSSRRGRFNDHDIEARLRQVEDPKFELTSRGFRWISEAPYHRY
jgi:hypothetical protein